MPDRDREKERVRKIKRDRQTERCHYVTKIVRDRVRKIERE